jgi:hypothetical protein
LFCIASQHSCYAAQETDLWVFGRCILDGQQGVEGRGRALLAQSRLGKQFGGRRVPRGDSEDSQKLLLGLADVASSQLDRTEQ